MQLERINWKNGANLSGLGLTFSKKKVTRNEQISHPAETDPYDGVDYDD